MPTDMSERERLATLWTKHAASLREGGFPDIARDYEATVALLRSAPAPTQDDGTKARNLVHRWPLSKHLEDTALDSLCTDIAAALAAERAQVLAAAALEPAPPQNDIRAMTDLFTERQIDDALKALTEPAPQAVGLALDDGDLRMLIKAAQGFLGKTVCFYGMKPDEIIKLAEELLLRRAQDHRLSPPKSREEE